MNMLSSSILPVFVLLVVKLALISAMVDVSCPSIPSTSRIHPCARDYTPVCGSNRKTYPNSCDFCRHKWENKKKGRSWNVFIEHEGRCEGKSSPASVKPTNGAIGFFQQVSDKYFPASSPNRGNQPTSNPDRLFQNRFPGNFPSQLWQILNRDLRTPYSQNRPNNRPYSSQVTSGRKANCGPYGTRCLRYGRVCGSDGQTYSSECELCAAANRSRRTLRIVKNGYC